MNVTKRFLIKLFLFCSPVLLLLLYYVVDDPYKVIYKNNYFDFNPLIFSRDYTSTQIYINLRKKFHYNAFIFGSSRTLAFRTHEWQKYLGKDARPFHFDAWAESTTGISQKMKFIDSHNDSIKYCLVLLDVGDLAPFVMEGGAYRRHPETEHSSWYRFQIFCLESFFINNTFIWELYYKMTGKMVGDQWLPSSDYEQILYPTNDLILQRYENEIAKDSSKYYKNGDFYNGKIMRMRKLAIKEHPQEINTQSLSDLEDIDAIFKKYGTLYRIIISPSYDQAPINRNDLQVIYNIFGKENVFDFSGKNFITNDRHYYYEQRHFRPIAGNIILQTIYSKNPSFK